MYEDLKTKALERKYNYLKILKAKLLHSNVNGSCFLLINLITLFNLMLLTLDFSLHMKAKKLHFNSNCIQMVPKKMYMHF